MLHVSNTKMVWLTLHLGWIVQVRNFSLNTFCASTRQNYLKIGISISLSHLGCGHCQNAKPKFLKASEAFADEPNKAFTTVDCTQDSGKSISAMRLFHWFSLSWRPMGKVGKDAWDVGKGSYFHAAVSGLHSMTLQGKDHYLFKGGFMILLVG